MKLPAAVAAIRPERDLGGFDDQKGILLGPVSHLPDAHAQSGSHPSRAVKEIWGC
jgi:hypothetical protein